MTPEQLEQARHKLGLSGPKMAAMLGTDGREWRRLVNPSDARHREPTNAQVRLIRAYLDGYRPADWPKWVTG